MYRLHELFNPDKVRQMVRHDPGLLSRLASEPEENVKRRAELKEQEKSLKAACDVCRENMIYSSVQFAQPATEDSTPPERGSPSLLDPTYQISGRATTSTHERSSSSSSASVESESTSLMVPSRGHSHYGLIGGSKPQDGQEEHEEL